jgi:hypothetical protein
MFHSFLLVLAAGVVSTPPVRDGGIVDAVVTEQGVAPPAASEPHVPSPTATSFPTASAALRVVLATQPRVLAVGEFHQTKATSHIASALKRFTRDFLPTLREAGASHLVVETWLTTGECGEEEKQAVAQVAKTTQRPARTENEVVTLLLRAKEAGIAPGVLEVACKDYQAMTSGREVDFDRLLKLTRDQLEKQIRAALARPDARLVLSYGGALHNDREPSPELAAYAFGPAMAKALEGRYVELDLYVPEFIEKDRGITSQPWYQTYRRAYRRGQVTLVRRSDSSFALVFPRSR